MNGHHSWTVLCLLIVLGACGQSNDGAEATTTATTTRHDLPAAITDSMRVDNAIQRLTREYFRAYPEQATYYGVTEDMAGGAYNDRLTTLTPAAETERRKVFADYLTELDALRHLDIGDDRRLTLEIAIDQLQAHLRPAAAVEYGQFVGAYGWFAVYPVNQLGGPHIDLPNLLEAQQPVKNKVDAHAYLTRLAGIQRLLEQAIEAIRRDEKLGVVPPDFIIDKTMAVIDRFVSVPPAENILAVAFARKTIAADIAGREQYQRRALAIIADSVYAGYRALREELARLRAQAVHDAGIWRLPNGAALYRALIRHHADVDMSAEVIHQRGLDEVERITRQMDEILRQQGITAGTVAQRMQALAEDGRFIYPDSDAGKAQIIADLNAQLTAINRKLPDWFATLPQQPVEVRRVPEFSEASAPGGYYDLPSLDGSRPGIYWVNLRDTAIWPKWSLPTLTYHEALPGHHLQIALAMAQEQPILRSIFVTNAFAEGWALYAEQLAGEMGMYEGDPYGDLGRLQDELHRAIRLVVDTGIHALRWSREKAIAYMIDVEGAHPSEAETEIERYAAWPGQALGYKIGMLKIKELRERSRAALGDRFDIRQFHDLILLTGGAPLPILERRVTAWIQAQQ